MLKMFSTIAFLCATLVSIFSRAQPYRIQGVHNTMPQPQHAMHPMLLPQPTAGPMMSQQNIPPMTPENQGIHNMMHLPQHNMSPMWFQQQTPGPMIPQQNIPPMTPISQGYSPMLPGILMPPPQRIVQDYQSPAPDNSFQQQLLLLIMSAYSRLTAYIQLLANQIKSAQSDPFNGPTGPNMNPTPGSMLYSPQIPVGAEQDHQNQLLLQQQQQAEYQQQLLDEEQRLQEEGNKQVEAEKLKSGELNLETENEELKKQPEKETKIIPQNSSKIQFTREQRRRPQRPGNARSIRKSPVKAQQDNHNQLLLQQQQKQAIYRQKLLDEEQRLQEEENHKQAEIEKLESEELNSESESEELKKLPEKGTKIIPQNSPKIQSTGLKRRPQSAGNGKDVRKPAVNKK